MDNQTYSFTPIAEDAVFPRWMQTTSIGICPLKANGKPLKAVKRIRANLSDIAALNTAARDYCACLNAMSSEEQEMFLRGETYSETIAPKAEE